MIFHHLNSIVNGKNTCDLCNSKMNEAHPSLVSSWNKIKDAFPDCHVSWAFRNEANQNLFLAEHKTRCPWPKSKHNFMKDGKPYSRAMDLFQISISSGKSWFLPEYYLRISDFIDTEILPLEWAGRWTQSKDHFVEMDHFELKNDIL